MKNTFKVGDRIEILGTSEVGKVVSIDRDTYLVLWDNRLVEHSYSKSFIETVCLLYTKKDEAPNPPFVLGPGDIWIPTDNSVKPENKPETVDRDKCYHNWQDVLLFQFTVTECSKCGIRRDEV